MQKEQAGRGTRSPLAFDGLSRFLLCNGHTLCAPHQQLQPLGTASSSRDPTSYFYPSSLHAIVFVERYSPQLVHTPCAVNTRLHHCVCCIYTTV